MFQIPHRLDRFQGRGKLVLGSRKAGQGHGAAPVGDMPNELLGMGQFVTGLLSHEGFQPVQIEAAEVE